MRKDSGWRGQRNMIGIQVARMNEQTEPSQGYLPMVAELMLSGARLPLVARAVVGGVGSARGALALHRVPSATLQGESASGTPLIQRPRHRHAHHLVATMSRSYARIQRITDRTHPLKLSFAGLSFFERRCMLRIMQSTDISYSISQKQPPLDDDLRHLVKEIRESFMSFLDRLKAGHAQTDQDELTLDRDLAVQVCERLADRQKQLAPLSLAASVNVLRWVNQIIRELCHNQRIDDALQLHERSAALTEHGEGVLYRPLVLLLAGQDEAAWQEARSALRSRQPPLELLPDVIEMYFIAGNLSAAENLARTILRTLPPELGLYGQVQSQLIRVLHKAGRRKEARQLESASRSKPRTFGTKAG